MKVVFFLHSVNSGGAENYLLRFLEYASNSINATVVCKGGYLGELQGEFLALSNCKLVPFRLGYFNIVPYLKLARYLKKGQFDVMCDFTGNFSGLVMASGWVSRVKRRIVFYRESSNLFEENALRLIYAQVMKASIKCFSSKILSNSNAALNFFYPTWEGRTGKYKVIYNGIDTSNFISSLSKIQIRELLGIPQNAFVVGHTGRLHPAKNHETILRVASALCERYESIYFLLAGKHTEELYSKYPGLIKNFKGRIICLGYRPDVNDILKAMDVYFFPSVTEGQPNALIEAMISGLPIVASAIDPIKETVPSKVLSALKDPFDVTGFVHQIESYFKSQIPMEDLSGWAKQRYSALQRFSDFSLELQGG